MSELKANRMPSKLPKQSELTIDSDISLPSNLQMGVLSDGTPFLTLRTLATLCGIDNSNLSKFVNDWPYERSRKKGRTIDTLLKGQGYDLDTLFIPVKYGEMNTSAFSDVVCMAFLEYYAFLADPINPIALKNFRFLARTSLREYIYSQTGYKSQQDESFKNFQTRVMMNNKIPEGYFSVFAGIADIDIQLIESGFAFDSKSIPDISVGQAWAKYWKENELSFQFGERIKYAHEYPEWYPQSRAWGGTEAWIYPLQAYGIFREFLQKVYIPQNLPKYLTSKISSGALSAEKKEIIISSLTPPTLENKN